MKNLLAALLEAQKSITSIGRTSRNDHQHYDYTSSEDMVTMGRAALNQNNLVLFAKSSTWIESDAGQSLMKQEFELAHATSGETMKLESEVPVCPGKGRPEDKSSFSSRTTGLSYLYRDLLQIPRVDEDEVDKRDDRSYEPKKTASKPRQTRPKVTTKEPSNSKGDEVRVIEIGDEKTSKKGSIFRRVTFALPGGEEVTCNIFNQNDLSVACKCHSDNVPVSVEFETKGDWTNVKDETLVPIIKSDSKEKESQTHTPFTDEEIPF
tara:strand:+ start:19527 stop:20321 length:795 start_codon:yes stop_codon:yes gene_type:complete